MSNIIDPHSVFDNLRNVNVEDLTFFAELKVTKRTRLTSSITNDETTVINFMGYSNNSGTFTTDWTNNDENFGIKRINITMNASYVPQVSIEFEDIRAHALFNKKGQSQYEVLMMMPPPIFDLKVKGFYGQTVSYRLHLVENKFEYGTNGFTVSSKFVGMTFAPLSDLLVDYIQVAPYLTNGVKTRSFVEFLFESKKLVNDIKVGISPNEDKIKVLEDDIYKLNEINNLGDPFINIKNSIDELINNGYSSIVTNEITYGLTDTSETTIKLTFNKFGATESRYDEFIEKLNPLINNYVTTLGNDFISASNTPNFNTINSISSTDSIMTIVFKLGTKGTKKSLDNKIKTKKEEVIKLKDYVDDYKNKIVTDSGVDPTLRGVLSLILENAYNFYNIVKQLVVNIESKNRTGIAGEGGEDAKYSFPDFFEYKTLNGTQTLVKTIPNGGQYDEWDEVRFVNDYINAKRRSAEYVETNIVAFETEKNKSSSYIPMYKDDNNIYNTDFNLNGLISNIIYRSIILNGITYKDNIIDNETFINLESEYILSIVDKNDTLKIGFEDYVNKYNTSVLERDTNYVNFKSNKIIISEDKQFEINDYYTQEPKLMFKDDLGLNTSFDLSGSYSGMTQLNIPMYVDNKYSLADNGEVSNEFNGGVSQYIKSNILDKLLDYQKNSTVIYYERSKMTLDRFLHIFIGNVNTPYEVLVKGNNHHSGFNGIPTALICKWYQDKDYLKNYSNKTVFEFKTFYDHISEKYFNSNYLSYWSTFCDLCDNFNKNKTDENIKSIVNSDLMKELFLPSFVYVKNYNVFTESSLINFNDIDKDSNILKFKTSTIKYINRLFIKLKETVKNRTIEKNKGSGAFGSSIEHMDLKTQLYYNFKKFVDRWIVNPPENIQDMFSDSSYFTVDRGFNDIGNDVVMDLSPLYELTYNADTSLYTMLLNLLSKNNFEFFALPSFIDYNKNGLWGQNNIQDIFGTHSVGEVTASPRFIAMYIGGTSSTLDLYEDGGYRNDSFTQNEGVLGLENTQVFRVDFGGGNQSFFNGLKCDQSEYKETNESIRLLDELTKSSENPTTRAGNSLMGIYEQRSYSVTVTMMGCMMIQPTMYFELNVPVLKGTYLILEVSHQIEDNNISTVFKGVRIPRVAKPYVNQSAIGFNTALNDGGGFNPNGVRRSQNNNTVGYGAVTLNVNNKVKAFMDVLAFTEGTMNKGHNDGYDYIYGGKFIPNWSNSTKESHPFLNNPNVESTASGRYQILRKSWIDFYGSYTPFNKENQDKLCYEAHLKAGWKRYKLDINDINKNNFVNYVDAVANYYASLPFYNSINAKMMPTYNWEAGLSFHSMIKKGERVSQIPKGKNNISQLWEVFIGALDVYDGKTANLSKLNQKQKNQVSQLHPSFQPVISNFINKVQQETPYTVVIISGYRTPSEQEDLTETNSLAGSTSLHTYGLAVDINLYNEKTGVTIVMGKGYSTRLKNKPKWESSGAVSIANSLNLRWGGYFSNIDLVHFEMTGRNGAKISTSELSSLMKSQNLTMANVDKLDLSSIIG